MNIMKVDCPRCGTVRTCYEGESETMCNCHKFCIDGDKPSDCTLVDHTASTVDAWGGKWNWPQGMYLGRDTGDDTQARVKWCTVHENYVEKVPFLIECDWGSFNSVRAPKRFRITKDV